MHSFTSSSETDADRAAETGRATPRFISRQLFGAALLLLIVMLTGLEWGTRIGFAKISSIESRIAREHAEVLRLRHNKRRPSVLLVGNSLLLEDVDMNELGRLLRPKLQVARLAIESTYFLDWKYGLRRLFEDGSQPDAVVLVLGPTHVIATEIRDEYSAFYLFRTSDIPAIGRELHWSRTQTSGLYAARFSLFWAGRNNLRNYVMGKAQPGYAEFLHHVSPRSAPVIPDREAIGMSRERLSVAREIAAAQDAHFAFVIAPGFFPALERDVLRGAKGAGVTAIAPVANGAWPAAYFRDGFHLNTTGAALFTNKLAGEMARTAGQESW